MNKQLKNIPGYTLIELMVTVAILAVITAFAIPAYQSYVETGQLSECSNEMAAIMLSESQFFLENNNTYYQGVGVVALQAASLGYYTPTATAANAAIANCAYTVTLGVASGYTITADGMNDLANLGVAFMSQTVN